MESHGGMRLRRVCKANGLGLGYLGIKNGKYYLRYWCYIGIMERKMETTVWGLEFCWIYIGIMEKKMKTTLSSIGVIMKRKGKLPSSI